jgi:long-chain acyl-CoA synthetase
VRREGFWAIASAHPEDPAVAPPTGMTKTLGDVLASANRLVHGLRARGLKRGDGVVVATKNCSAFVEVFFAAMQAGWYFAPVSARSTAYELAPQLLITKAKHTI